ncbi:hypothetical protein CDD81_3496 [Ophiocordyceps australis]|uniref:Nitrogen permease regulator 3 n=1 Tax=Ophiocordyceps australis TaxID=1399860 RepID=A0A2C5X785_9HYPO|nr:hypothetical protein CDD81_3496 [Ophiocordyceps australis]
MAVESGSLVAVALIINRSRDGPAFVFHYPPHVPQPAEAPRDAEDVLLRRQADSDAPCVPWERVAGFPTRDLASILTPARSYHKALFQLSLDPLLCISYPIHVPDNGKWKKVNKHEHQLRRSSPTPRDKTKDEAPDDDKRSSMTMFNLVLMLNPNTKHQVKELVDALYRNIVKKVNKAYKYSQQHSDFIWKESKRILAAKDKAREDGTTITTLWKEILHISSLAASVRDIFDSVSHNKIATLHLDTASGVLTPSLQIPAPFFASDLPPPHDQSQLGLWLTTANVFLSHDALEEPGFFDRTFALLIKEDEKKIISELQTDRDPATLSMIDFVRLAKPTTSFHQIGQNSALTLGQVRKYAQHFIFWRRAIAIPPLHARDVYIVSPNCHLARLPQACHEWQRAFPVAPPLPNFLAELSMCPKQYKLFCPSKAHRPLYLRMLAWLLRGAWVTQLCTFAYVVVWPEIIYEVDYEMEAEELAAADAHDTGSSSSPSPPSLMPHRRPDASARPTVQQAAEKARLERIALRAQRQAADKATAHARRIVPLATLHPSTNDAPHLAAIEPRIVLDARRATGKESRYLSAIALRLSDEKVRSAWTLMCRYFDGRCALERIALQQDYKRKDVAAMLSAMSEYLLCTRHW